MKPCPSCAANAALLKDAVELAGAFSEWDEARKLSLAAFYRNEDRDFNYQKDVMNSALNKMRKPATRILKHKEQSNGS